MILNNLIGGIDEDEVEVEIKNDKSNKMLYIVIIAILIIGTVIYFLFLAPTEVPTVKPTVTTTIPIVTASPTVTAAPIVTAAPTVTAAPYIPFVAGTQTATNMNDDGGGNTIYLDRHTMDCGNKGLNQLYYQRKQGGCEFQYKYTCATGGSLGPVTQQATPFNDEGGGNSIFLDRHNPDCGNNNVMTKLHLQRSGNNTYQLQYACAPNTQPQQLNCRNVTTPFNDDGGGNSIYLDRHDIRCNSNEAIQQLRLVRGGTTDANRNPNQYQYQYKCCS